MRHIALLVALFCASCATMPEVKDGGLPMGKSGWQFSGGADFERKMWFLLFYKPWGKQELDSASLTEQILIPE